MDIVVFGAGSLGSLVGALLARVHDVTLVGRDPHVATVREDGLRVTGCESFTVSPAARTDGTGLSADFALVTVKAFDTEVAARDLATGSFDAVCSLQNGMGNEDVLARHLAGPVLAGTTTHGARRRDPGVVEWTGRGDVVIGPWTPAETPVVDDVAAAFRAANVTIEVATDMRARLWEKLAVNAAINPVTALARVENGALSNGPAGDVARMAAREAARVARADGIDLPNARALDRFETVAEATADNRSSMYQDVAADRQTEIDAIGGYILDRGSEHGLDLPVTRTLTAMLRAWEAGRGLR